MARTTRTDETLAESTIDLQRIAGVGGAPPRVLDDVRSLDEPTVVLRPPGSAESVSRARAAAGSGHDPAYRMPEPSTRALREERMRQVKGASRRRGAARAVGTTALFLAVLAAVAVGGYAYGQNQQSVGYDQGYSAGQSAGASTGQESGYNQGFNEGRSEGYSEGYDKGFDAGVISGKESAKDAAAPAPAASPAAG